MLTNYEYSDGQGTMRPYAKTKESKSGKRKTSRMALIAWEDFEKVEIRAGTITRVEDFPQARKPAYKVWVDFGEAGIKKSSAQITTHYTKEQLLGKQVVGVVNFPPKQIGPFVSEALITGFADGNETIILSQPERPVPNGARLC